MRLLLRLQGVRRRGRRVRGSEDGDVIRAIAECNVFAHSGLEEFLSKGVIHSLWTKSPCRQELSHSPRKLFLYCRTCDDEIGR